MLNRESRKENALKNLAKIGCYKPYLNAFKKGTITMYEGFGGYYVTEPELLQKISEIEDRYEGTVYAVIHQLTEFGELYTMLWATGYEEDADNDVSECSASRYYVMSYVWNKTHDDCSEFGSVVIQPALGGLVRVG